jgi:hypothetical protein
MGSSSYRGVPSYCLVVAKFSQFQEEVLFLDRHHRLSRLQRKVKPSVKTNPKPYQGDPVLDQMGRL